MSTTVSSVVAAARAGSETNYLFLKAGRSGTGVRLSASALSDVAARASKEPLDGVLIGHIDPGVRDTLVVDLCLPVNARYWTEEGRLEEPENRAAFERTMARFGPSGDASGVVGYFRAGAPAADPELDRGLMREYFLNPPALFISIDGAQCSVLLWNDGKLEACGRTLAVAAKPKSSGKLAWWSAAAATILISGGLLAYRLAPKSSAPSPGPMVNKLDLRVEHEGNDLRVTWPQNAADKYPNAQALLNIVDGGSSKQVVVSPQLLATGYLVYHPSSGDVVFLLDIVDSGERKLSGSARYLTFGEEPKAQAPAPLEVQPVPQSATRARTVPEPAATTPAVRTAPKAFVIPPIEHKEVRPEVLEPPKLAVGLSTGPVPQIFPKVTIVPPPAAPPRAIVPPQVKQEVRVIVPTEVRPLMKGTVTMQVRAFIDVNGRVYRADVLSPSNGFVLSNLARAAREATMRWQFTPARKEGGERLPSEIVLKYVISR